MAGIIKQLTFAEGVNPTSPTELDRVRSKIYQIEFSAESSKNVDTSGENIDATKSIVQVRNDTGDVVSGFDISASDADTLVIAAGGNISGTFNVHVAQCFD